MTLGLSERSSSTERCIGTCEALTLVLELLAEVASDASTSWSGPQLQAILSVIGRSPIEQGVETGLQQLRLAVKGGSSPARALRSILGVRYVPCSDLDLHPHLPLAVGLTHATHAVPMQTMPPVVPGLDGEPPMTLSATFSSPAAGKVRPVTAPLLPRSSAAISCAVTLLFFLPSSCHLSNSDPHVVRSRIRDRRDFPCVWQSIAGCKG